MTPEGRVKEDLKAYLKSLGDSCWYYMPVPMGYGKRGVPDFIICYKGHFLAPETKAGKETSKPWQDEQQQQIRAAGGKSLRVTDIEVVRKWIEAVDLEHV